MANEKKAKLLDLSGTRPAVLLHGSRLSWSVSNHDVFGKLKHVACVTSSLLL